jgi:hypothetical protein
LPRYLTIITVTNKITFQKLEIVKNRKELTLLSDQNLSLEQWIFRWLPEASDSRKHRVLCQRFWLYP